MMENQPPIKKSRKPLYISVAIITSIVLGYFFVPGIRQWLDEAWAVLTSGNQERIRDWVSDFGWFGPLLIIIAMVLQMFLIVIPSWLLMVVAILAYGPVWGSLIVFSAIFLASTTGYYIGKFVSREFLLKLIGTKAERNISDFLENYGIWAIIITRINPLISNDAISFIAGILRMGYRKFILSTLAGIAPLIIFIAALGELTDGLKTGLLWLSIVSLTMFIAFVWWDKNRKSNISRRQKK